MELLKRGAPPDSLVRTLCIVFSIFFLVNVRSLQAITLERVHLYSVIGKWPLTNVSKDLGVILTAIKK